MTEPAVPVILTPLLGFPEVRGGDNLAELILTALRHNGTHLMDGDILVVSSKVVSKAMGLRAPAGDVAAVVRSQTVRVVAERTSPRGLTRIVESVAGPVMAAAGVDASNTTDTSTVLVLPDDPDAVAETIRSGVQSGWAAAQTGSAKAQDETNAARETDAARDTAAAQGGTAETPGAHLRVGVILSDTAGRPWRTGQVDFALGAAGIHVVDDLRGSTDADGRILAVTERCVADEIASAADLVKDKATGVPAAHIRGLGQHVVRHLGQQVGQHVGRLAEQHLGRSAEQHPGTGKPALGARSLVRTGPQDWFAYGAVEAVRAALGVEPGSATATAVGIASMTPESVATRAGRALRVALLTCPEVTGHLDSDALRLVAADDFTLGVAVTRAQVALHGEGLTTTLKRSRATSLASGLTAQPSAQIVFRQD